MNEDLKFWGGLGILCVGIIGFSLWFVPTYNVWSREMSGKSQLRAAEWSKQILIEDAAASKQSEILRAEGVAQANKIIGESLEGNNEYLTYLWLQHLGDQSSKVIYVPTESNLPILEAGRFNAEQ